MNHFHPIQLNFCGYINNSTLSDIKLKANIAYEETTAMNIDDSKDEHKFNESNMSLASLDENEMSSLDCTDSETEPVHIKQSKDGIIHCHWDIIRARCIVFDLIFHAMFEHRTDSLPIEMRKISVHRSTNTIHFDVSYEALLIVIKYLYTGLTRSYDYDDIRIARDVIELANVLHLHQLSVDINGQFLNSRKRLKDDMCGTNIDMKLFQKWKLSMKLETFDLRKWTQINPKSYFLNINVLYEFNYEMYKCVNGSVNSRQLISINKQSFEISKIIFASVSEYFNALFCKEFAKNDRIEMNEIKAKDFAKLQRFLYTFDQSNYFCQKLVDLDFESDTNESIVRKKEFLKDCISALHLSIFFGIDDLRQSLLFIIEKYYLCNHTLYGFWRLGFEFELKDIKEMCSDYFSQYFGDISCDTRIFMELSKRMIKSGLSNGKIRVSTEHMIRVLLQWAQFHDTSIQELLPPNTLFNEANKTYVLSNRKPINLQHLLRL